MSKQDGKVETLGAERGKFGNNLEKKKRKTSPIKKKRGKTVYRHKTNCTRFFHYKQKSTTSLPFEKGSSKSETNVQLDRGYMVAKK